MSEPARKGGRDGGREGGRESGSRAGVTEGARGKEREGGGGVGEGMERACGQKSAFRNTAETSGKDVGIPFASLSHTALLHH